MKILSTLRIKILLIKNIMSYAISNPTLTYICILKLVKHPTSIAATINFLINMKIGIIFPLYDVKLAL